MSTKTVLMNLVWVAQDFGELPAIQLHEAKMLAPYRSEIHETGIFLSGGTCRIWRVNGAIQTWKRDSSRVKVPIKTGFRGPYSYVTETNLDRWHLPENCPQMRGDSNA